MMMAVAEEVGLAGAWIANATKRTCADPQQDEIRHSIGFLFSPTLMQQIQGREARPTQGLSHPRERAKV